MADDRIACALCGLECSMQISASHLRAAHGITTKEYRAMGYQTVSPARLEQLRRSPVATGNVRRPVREAHWNWKGGHVNGSGYRVVQKRGGRPIYEHRHVAEQMIGRPLRKDEVVHHKDGNRLNNDPSNLEVMTKREHDRLRPGAKRFYMIHDETREAAHVLVGLGWSQAKVARALRVEASNVGRWLNPEA